MIEYKEVTEHNYTNEGYEKVTWDDCEIWYMLDGSLYREDGPARIGRTGYKDYWLNDIRVIPSSYHLFSPLQLAKLGLI